MSAGKGSKPRPVNLAKYQANYTAIFRRPPVGTAGPAVRLLDSLDQDHMTRADLANVLAVDPSNVHITTTKLPAPR